MAVRVHRLDQAESIDHAGRVRKQLADPGAALPMPAEFENGRHQRETILARGHGGQALTLPHRVGEIDVEHFPQARLVVEEVHLGRSASLAQIDHPLGPGLEVG